VANVKSNGVPWGLLVALSVLSVVVLSACAGPASAGATPTPSPSPNPQQQALEFAQCMRANGVPDFPDPSSAGGGGSVLGNGSGIDPNDPAFQKAQQACRKYLQGTLSNQPPPDKATQAKELKFAQCMRANGVPSFPDPDASGRLDLGSVDPNDPAFQKAQQTCSSILGMPSGSTSTTGGSK